MVWGRSLLGSQGQPEYRRASRARAPADAGSHADGGGRHTGSKDERGSPRSGTASGTLFLPEMKNLGHAEFTESPEKHASPPSGPATLEGACLPFSFKTHFIC